VSIQGVPQTTVQRLRVGEKAFSNVWDTSYSKFCFLFNGIINFLISLFVQKIKAFKEDKLWKTSKNRKSWITPPLLKIGSVQIGFSGSPLGPASTLKRCTVVRGTPCIRAELLFLVTGVSIAHSATRLPALNSNLTQPECTPHGAGKAARDCPHMVNQPRSGYRPRGTLLTFSDSLSGSMLIHCLSDW
jgi:hypothetical protein